MICCDFVWEHFQLLDLLREGNVFYPLGLVTPGPGIRQIGTIPYAPSFPDDVGGRESTFNTGDKGLILGSGRFPGGGHGSPLQYSCLENPMDRGGWRAIIQRVTKSLTRLKQFSMHVLLYLYYFSQSSHKSME